MKKHKLVKYTVISFVALLVASLIAIVYCNKKISDSALGKLYTNSNSIPHRHVGLILGTSKYIQNHQINLYYAYRIQAAVELFKAQKIDYLIISGDNGNKYYNEPKAMQADLIAAGIDSSKIYLDYAGFRTHDSMIRLKKIFNQTKVTVISQAFHNERAIYLAQHEGIDAIGYNAADVNANYGFKTMLREKLARVKVFVDRILNTQAKFLGQPVVIPNS